MRSAIIGVSLVAFVLSTLWAFNKPGYDSVISVVVTLGALLTTLVVKKEKQTGSQVQEVSDKSVAIQAGRDASVGDIGR